LPDAVGVFPALLAFLAACFLIALSRAYDYSLGALLRVLASALNVSILGTNPLGFLSSAVLSLDNDIRNAIGLGIEQMQQDAAAWFSWFAQAMEATGGVIADLAESTHGALRLLLDTSIPDLIITHLATIKTLLARTVAESRAAASQVPRAVTNITKVARYYPVTVQRVTGLPKLILATVSAAIAGGAISIPFPRIGPFERDIAAIKKRLAGLRDVLGVGAIVGATGYALSKLGLADSQCSNAKRWNKGMCSAPNSWLENFLLGTIAIFGTLSLVEFAKTLQGITVATDAEIRRFWRADVSGAVRNPGLGDVA